MKSRTRLDSAVFQLTPTRTRCDLIIIANGKKEKIASGLLKPFLAHLKTAQDQVDKGGYSILLEPETESDAAWFTKATVERFVRFVSTPEILERVYTLENEILQIEEAMAMQSSNVQSIVEDHQEKPSAGCEGNKSVLSAHEEKAIVLYKPGAQPSEANGSCSQEGNSKVQLVKVLETRKMVLQKEQGMAFARAVAAGFDYDQIQPLVSFAECFGAMRLMEACSRFINLWKTKHETGQWLDIEASEGLSTQSDFSAMNSSSVILSATPLKNDESNHQLALENNPKSCSTNNADNPVPNGHQEYIQGQFPHLVFPPWAMHAPPGGQPVFPAYPVQGMPYYQAYTGNGPFFQQSHNPMEHYPPNVGHKSGQEMQSPDGKDSNTLSQTWEIDRKRSLDKAAEVSLSRESRKRAGESNTKQPGMVVIRNINYINSKEKKSGSESGSSGIDTDNEDSEADGHDMIHDTSKRSINSKGRHLNNAEVSKSDDGHWRAFQTCLLRGNDDDSHTGNEGMFAMEKDLKVKRRASTRSDDPLDLGSRHTGDIQDTRMGEIQGIGASTFRLSRESGDATFLSRTDSDFRGTNGRTDIQFAETNGIKILPRTTHEDYMIGSQQHSTYIRNSSDPLAVNGREGSIKKMDREPSHGTADETFIVPFRSLSIDQAGPADRNAIDIDSEIPSVHQKFDSKGNRNMVNYEPNDLSLMPERGTEKRSAGYDLALEYEMQVCAGGSQEKQKEDATDVKGLRKDQKSKNISGSFQKQRTGGPIRKGKSSKMTPLEDARERAERLRSYKADMQKVKKEKEEAEAKRLEALKLERQKRIAARNKSSAVKPATLSPHIKQLPAKLSPVNKRGSKFSDSEPGSSSPLQRSKIKTSLGSNELLKVSKATKLSESSKMTGNRLTGSSSSLTGTKRESNGVTPDSKASMARIRRLSEPKVISSPPVTLVKARSAEAVSKRKLSGGPERNKISAIINLDRSKAAALPELKIKAPKSNLNAGEKQSAVKDGQKLNEIKLSTFRVNAELNSSNCTTAYQIDADESPIVEKTVVMLEYEKPCLSTLHSSDAKSKERNQLYDDCERGEKRVMSELAPTYVAPSSKVEKRSDPSEVRMACPEKDLPSNTPAVKPSRAPNARVSFLEDPCTGQSYYSKTPRARTELVSRVEETAKAHVPGVKPLKTGEYSATSKKTLVKESSKGLKRLLKFGKKTPSSSVDQRADLEHTIVDGTEHNNARSAAGTSEVHMLKNLISQDETTLAGNASQKTSRHFSLFSPFRSKTSEKKQAS